MVASSDQKLYVAQITNEPPLYTGAKLSALVPPTGKRMLFTVPEGDSFKLKVALPTSATVDRFTLKDVRLLTTPLSATGQAATGRAAEATQVDADATQVDPEATQIDADATQIDAEATQIDAEATQVDPEATQIDEEATQVDAEEAADQQAVVEATVEVPIEGTVAEAFEEGAESSSRARPTTHNPIPIQGTFQAIPKPSKKAPMGKVHVSIAMPWVEPMYPKAKLSVYIPLLAKTVSTMIPAQRESIELSLTLPDRIGTEAFAVGPISITSGPPPATTVDAPPEPPLQAAVVSSMAQAVAAVQAAVAVPSRPVVVAQAVPKKRAPSAKPPPAAKVRKVVPKAKPRAQKPRVPIAKANRKAVTKPKAPTVPNASKAKAVSKPKRATKPRARAPMPAPPTAPPTAQPTRSGRSVKRANKFGDRGEFEGAASAFRSTPIPSKPMPPLAMEYSVPAYCLPGEGQIWAYGLHAGIRKRFKARVLKLRTAFPRIVVRYEEDEDGQSHSLALPEVKTAYLSADQVEPLR